MRTYILGAASIVLMACTPSIQTSSGADYLAGYEVAAAGEAQLADNIDREIAAAAGVEPLLRLPARFGVARIDGCGAVAIPDKELSAWAATIEGRSEIGEFVSVASDRPASYLNGQRNYWRRHCADDPVMEIRQDAARQHLDAVLVYAVDSKTEKSNTMLAIADLTIIGAAILPTRSIEGTAYANASLVDVRNGYRYGSAQADARDSSLSPSFGSDGRTHSMRGDVEREAVEKLVPKVEKMLSDLLIAMSTKVMSKT